MGTGNWDEFRTAYQVAKHGTVSGAASALGVHHATVIRHVDALEERLGVKLFQRHSRGYTPTEAGAELMQVGAATDDQLTQLVGRIRGHGDQMTGEIIVTTVAGAEDILVPMLVRFQRLHPGLIVRFITDSRLFRLEYGEAHLAIRAGQKPEEPDNVVQPFAEIGSFLCASPKYAGFDHLPKDPSEFSAHKFVSLTAEFSRAPVSQWMQDWVPPENVAFRTTEMRSAELATCAGAGIGFVSVPRREKFPELVDVMEPLPEWMAKLWLVTHVDLHRTPKVNALVQFLKAEALALR